jgi:serine/threonine protein kinase
MAALQQNVRIGSHISRYAIVDRLGTGAMAEVFKARDETLRRDVAVKIIRMLDGSDREYRDLLANEARALSRVNHPHVAAIYDFFTESERDVIVMEYVPGRTLKDVLATGPLPIAEVIRLGRQILTGLSAAHEAHVVHRDIKPANIKVTPAGGLKILDFGVARMLPVHPDLEETTYAATDTFLTGTIPYMAPEQLLNLGADERSDMFSVGAVLYEMATGRRAFPQRQTAQVMDAILHADPPAPSTIAPAVPRSFERALALAMSKDPAKRYRTAAQFSDALGAVRTTPRVGALSRVGEWVAWGR